jgi:hypothetical protein
MLKIVLVFISTAIGLAMSQSMSSMSPAPTASVNNSAAEFSITGLPAVTALPACVANCLIPVGLADASGCDDVTNDCACLSAPAGAMGEITDCVNTVCTGSTASFVSMAVSQYSSYCLSIYGSASLSSAAAQESSSSASAMATANGTSSATGASATKSESPSTIPSL